jgi:hypothetical protein
MPIEIKTTPTILMGLPNFAFTLFGLKTNVATAIKISPRKMSTMFFEF